MNISWLGCIEDEHFWTLDIVYWLIGRVRTRATASQASLCFYDRDCLHSTALHYIPLHYIMYSQLQCIILHCIQPWLEEDLVYNVLYCTLYHTEKNYLFIPLQWTYIYIQIFPKNLGKLHSAQCSTFFGWDNDIWGRYLPAFAGLIVQNIGVFQKHGVFNVPEFDLGKPSI